MRKHIIVKLTDAEAVALLVAADLYANELMEGTGRKDAAITRASRKIEEARIPREQAEALLSRANELDGKKK